MPVNKGLLISAAIANGFNAFLDAREKGDLQRQRQALADVEEQMKTAQMNQAQQRLDLGEKDFGLREKAYETGLEQYAVKQALAEKKQVADIAAKKRDDEIRLITQKRMLEVIRQRGLPDPLSTEEKFRDAAVRGSGLAQLDGETREDYDVRLWGIIEGDGTSPETQQLAFSLLGFTGQNQQNIFGQTQQMLATSRINYLSKQTEALIQAIDAKKKVTPDAKLKLVKLFQGASEDYPDLAEEIAAIDTMDEFGAFLGNPQTMAMILSMEEPTMIKTPDGGVSVVDNNDLKWNKPNPAMTVLVAGKPGYEGLEASDISSIESSKARFRGKWESNYSLAYREVATKFSQFRNQLAGFNAGEIRAPEFDVVLISDFRKLLDEGSVVRESEFRIVGQLQDFWNKMIGKWEAEAKGRGGMLTAKSRSSLINAILRLMKGVQEEYLEQYAASASEPSEELPYGGSAYRVTTRFSVLESQYGADVYDKVKPVLRELLGPKPLAINLDDYKLTRFLEPKKVKGDWVGVIVDDPGLGQSPGSTGVEAQPAAGGASAVATPEEVILMDRELGIN